MLNGLDPIIIFEFKTSLASIIGVERVSKIPLVSGDPALVPLPPIPIYLAENITGLMIDNEDKVVDINTTDNTMSDGTTPETTQKGISSTITVNLTAIKGSIGVTLLTAMIDQIYEKVSSKEYSITYMHGAITIFRGELHNYTATAETSTDKINIKFDISRGQKTPVKAAGIGALESQTGTQPLD